MKYAALVLVVLLVAHLQFCSGQEIAGSLPPYSRSSASGKEKAQETERAKRVLAKDYLPPTSSSMFVEAHVLINVKADEFVAHFSINHEATTVAECIEKMNVTVKEFTTALKNLGIVEKDLHVDFIAQNKIYGYEVTNNIAKEKLMGFEVKKNVSIRYRDRDMIEKLTVTAAQSKIFDLIKVDYIVKDAELIQDQLMEEATRIIKRKKGRYERLLDIKFQPMAQVYAERPSIHYPTQMYDSYRAFEAESVARPYDQRYTVHELRKSRTVFFNPLDGDGFDVVINPITLEPVVQFTIYLKVKYDLEQTKAK